MRRPLLWLLVLTLLLVGPGSAQVHVPSAAIINLFTVRVPQVKLKGYAWHPDGITRVKVDRVAADGSRESLPVMLEDVDSADPSWLTFSTVCSMHDGQNHFVISVLSNRKETFTFKQEVPYVRTRAMLPGTGLSVSKPDANVRRLLPAHTSMATMPTRSVVFFLFDPSQPRLEISPDVLAGLSQIQLVYQSVEPEHVLLSVRSKKSKVPLEPRETLVLPGQRTSFVWRLDGTRPTPGSEYAVVVTRQVEGTRQDVPVKELVFKGKGRP